ncbi:hypothetical protein scyTo_0014279 [Scyliorhinus torazame]|uniref:Mediator of DNA damage checkpoint protein 1 n=1 Tax=Scyliorhinus torazame TaxID=75743 RepID=A0A401NJN7_SCYTO|nr:hypothetical protein [Scyliorhinus torazame]
MEQTQLLSWEAEEEQLRDSDRQARGRLRVFAGSQGPEAGFLVYTGENVIGRHESCHIRIPAQSVSKKHAVIEIEGDTHLIHDCNSLNKTRRRNAILKPSVRYAINDGDLFLFADVACQYVLLPAEDDDSGSETGSESVFPQSRAGAGGQRPDGVAGDGLVSKATGGELESAEDSLMLSPSQPYQTKSPLPFQPDTYVKESEDDDTPWKGPFVPQDGRHPNASVRETPSAHIVPESDDEESDSSCSNAQSMQLHYNSDTDLDEDQKPCVKWVEASREGPANGNCVNSETGGAAEQRSDNPSPATGGIAPATIQPPPKAVSLVETLDHDAGRGSSRGPSDLLPHLSWDSDSEVELKNDGPAVPTETNSGLVEGADVREAGAVVRDRRSSLIRPDEEEGSIKADVSTHSSAGSDGEAKGTAGSVNQGELLEVNSDTDADDDTEAYALQATQCFTLRVSDTQDERSVEDDYPPDGDTAAAEEATQLFISESPRFDKGTCKGNTASVSNAEEEATQLFTLESPAFGQNAFKKPIPSGFDRGGQLGNAKGDVAAASETEDEATQPFMAGAVTQWPRDSTEPGGEQQAEANQEDQWADVETQPFCLESQASEVECAGESEQKFNFKLAESLEKAREEPLLKDFRVHVTAGVLPEPGQMESIVQCSGATILPKMPRAYKEKTLVISCPDDLPKCKAARDAGVPVVNAEFILTGILQQTVDLVSYRLDGESDSQPYGKAKKRSATTQSASSRKKKR